MCGTAFPGAEGPHLQTLQLCTAQCSTQARQLAPRAAVGSSPSVGSFHDRRAYPSWPHYAPSTARSGLHRRSGE
eukprot:6196510-Alexandrium_andersonii.AAC.1